MNITQSIVSERDRAILGGDYEAYHSQAVRRLHALRRRLGVATPKGRKFTPKSLVTSENVAQNTQWIQLLLASSERDWAHAMAMKSAQSPENTQKSIPGSTKKQIISRIRRAISHAENLAEVVENHSISGANDVDILEARAYLALLKGGLAFEKSQWESCIKNYSISRVVYGALDSNSKSDVFKDLLSATVDPSIRYAAHQLKLSRTKLISDIAIEDFPSSEATLRSHVEKIQPGAFITSSEKSSTEVDQPSQLPTTITWRSRKVKIEDAAVSQTLGLAYDKERAFETTFETHKEGELDAKNLALSFDDVIDTQQDVVDAAKNVIDELRSEGVDQGDNRIQSLQVVRTAVNYAVIEWRIGRNRILCGADDGLNFESEQPKQNLKPRKDGKSRQAKEESSGKRLSRLRERVVLYDSTLQSIDSVKELPGVVADTDFVAELDAKRAYFQALKCIAIGRAQAINGSVLKALALYSRASTLSHLASSQIKALQEASDVPYKITITTEQLKALQKLSTSLSLQYQALVELSRAEQPASSKGQSFEPPLIERFYQERFDNDLDLKNLVNYPPRLQPVAVKPLFFDLAWNYIQYPGQTANVNGNVASTTGAANSSEAKPAKKGWFGFGR